MRHGEWKLQIAMGNKAGPDAGNFQPKLYNLRKDIGEANDVAAANPDVVAQLQALIAATKDDLGRDDITPACRELGRVENPKPLIPHDTQ